MKQLRTKRYWASKAFNPGNTDTIDLPLGLDLEAVHLYLSGTLTTGAGYTGIMSEGMSKLIKRIEVLVDGETRATTTMDLVVGGNFKRNGGVIRINPAFAAGATSGEAVGFLDFANIGGVRPKDSSLVTAGKRQIQLRITWGQFTDMYVGAGSVTTSNISLAVGLYETKEEGTNTGDRLYPEFQRLYRLREFSYAGSMVDKIPLDPDLLYSGIVLRVQAGATGDLSTTVLNNVKIQIGTEIPFDMPAAMILDANTQDNGFAMPGGFYVVDFSPSPHGLSKISDFMDTTGHNNDCFLLLDVNGGGATPNKVQVLQHQFVHNRLAGAHNAEFAKHNR